MVANIESNIAGPDATRYDVFNGVEVILYKKAGSRKCNVLFCFTGTGCHTVKCLRQQSLNDYVIMAGVAIRDAFG
jgi:hypothetical protein